MKYLLKVYTKKKEEVTMFLKSLPFSGDNVFEEFAIFRSGPLATNCSSLPGFNVVALRVLANLLRISFQSITTDDAQQRAMSS